MCSFFVGHAVAAKTKVSTPPLQMGHSLPGHVVDVLLLHHQDVGGVVIALPGVRQGQHAAVPVALPQGLDGTRGVATGGGAYAGGDVGKVDV